MFAKALSRRDFFGSAEAFLEPRSARQAPAQPIPFRRTNAFAPAALAAAKAALSAQAAPATAAAPAVPSPPSVAQQALWAKAESVLEGQHKWLAGFNKSLPSGLSIVAVPLIPTAVWWREQGDFLMHAFAFFPASVSNTMLAAGDPTTSRILNLPLAPRVHNKLLEDSTHQRLCQLRQRFATEHENMGHALVRGDFSSLGSSAGRKARYGRELIDIATSIGAATFGKQAWEAHERYFFSILGMRKV